MKNLTMIAYESTILTREDWDRLIKVSGTRTAKFHGIKTDKHPCHWIKGLGNDRQKTSSA